MKLSKKLLRWYKKYGRHDLPWQKRPTPYRVWISEIMLQQTQVATVIPYYQRFMESFPNLKALATADINEVLSHWSGLGYYARARNIHKTAKIITLKHHGRFPKTVEALSELPGIGRSTAGAIASFSMGISAPILDGNVKRVLTRIYAVEGWPGSTTISNLLWKLAEKNTPEQETNAYNQAIMDLGATVCTRTKPQCDACPFENDCLAHQRSCETQFPNKKPKKSIPTKHIHALLIRQENGDILLQKRPPTGIWGGLWAFPECSLDEEIERYCEKHYGTKVNELQTWETLYHQFSHFKLEITPLLLNVSITGNRAMDSDHLIWYKLGNSLPGGIATPVNKLLKKIEEAYEPYDFL